MTKARGKGPEAIIGIISMRGVEGLDELHHSGAASKDSIRRAMKDMLAAGHPAAKRVESWYISTFGGNAAPLQVGETRNYKIQANKAGKPFFKLPVPDAEPGRTVAVTRTKDAELRVSLLPE